MKGCNSLLRGGGKSRHDSPREGFGVCQTMSPGLLPHRSARRRRRNGKRRHGLGIPTSEGKVRNSRRALVPPVSLRDVRLHPGLLPHRSARRRRRKHHRNGKRRHGLGIPTFEGKVRNSRGALVPSVSLILRWVCRCRSRRRRGRRA